MIVFDLIVFFEKSQGYAARGKSARVPGGRGLSDKKRACIVTWRSKGGQAFHSCGKKGMNPRQKLSGGGIRRRRERIRTPSCVPTRTATKMHHVHRRGRITSRDGAWGILLSPEVVRRGSPPEGSIGETLAEAGPVCQFTGHGAGKGGPRRTFPQPRRKQGRIERRVRRSRGCGDPYPKHPKARIRLPSPKRAQTPGAIQRDNAR